MLDHLPGAAPFLAAIREAPDDPTSRKVFADWLDEQDEPHAHWFREDEIWAWMSPDAHDPVPGLLNELLAPDWEQRRDARDLIKKLGPPAVEVVRNWTREDPAQRFYETRFILDQVRPCVLRPVDELIEVLQAECRYERWQAVIDLGFHGEDAVAAIPALCQSDNYQYDYEGGDHETVTETIIELLEKFGAAAATEAIPYLCKHLDCCANVREAAWAALLKIAPHAPDVMLANVGRVYPDDSGHHMGISILAQTHPEGYAVLARILRGEGKVNEAVLMVASLLQGGEWWDPPKLSPEEVHAVLPPLIEAIRKPARSFEHHYNRMLIANALAAMGEVAADAVPGLRAALAEYDQPVADDRQREETREAIATALTQLGDTEVGLASLLPGLSASEPAVRSRAVERLAEVAATTPEAIPHLLTALRDPVSSVRETASVVIRELASTQSDPTVLVPVMLESLDDSTANVRTNLVTALGKMKGKRPDFLTQLVMPGKQGPHPDAYDRRELVDLENRVVDRLCRALGDGALSVRTAALEALGRWDELPASAVEHLVGFVNGSRDNRAITSALGVLRKGRELPESLIPPMVGLFSRRDEQLAGAAADLLTKVGEPAVPALIEVLQQGNRAVVRYAIRALHDMSWRAAAAAPHLLPFASSRDADRRAFVIEILGQMRVPEVALPTFRKALKDRNADVRQRAAWAINRLGAEGAEAIPELLKRVKDSDDGVRLAVIKALGSVGADEATLLRVYQSAVGDTYESIRSHALGGLAVVAKGHPEVFAGVTPHCQDKDRYVRTAAIRAVCELAPSASDAAPWVRKLLDDPEEYVRDAASEAFLALGPAASSADPELFCRLAGQGARVSRLLVRTMQALTRREREDLIPTLVEELGDDDINGRQSAALWLRALGADGEAALREASQNADPNIRSAAEFGLKAREEGED